MMHLFKHNKHFSQYTCLFFIMLICFSMLGCAKNAQTSENLQQKNNIEVKKTAADSVSKNTDTNENNKGDISVKGQKLKITVGNKEITATLEDNAATRALIKKLPMTLPMQNLYSREMCYRYGAGGLPTASLRSDRYEVGDIVYWPPRGSLVILYAQNGEQFERQQLGHIDNGVDIFNQSGDVDVKFELVK